MNVSLIKRRQENEIISFPGLSCNIVIGILLEFGVDGDAWKPRVIIWLKIGLSKTKNVVLTV